MAESCSSRRRLRIDLIAIADAVTDATHVADEIRAELAPQVVQMNLDCVARYLFVPTVQALLELIARDHAAWLLEQRVQQGELARRQADRLTVDLDPTRRRVEHDRAVSNERIGAPAAPAQQCAHTRDHLVEV